MKQKISLFFIFVFLISIFFQNSAGSSNQKILTYQDFKAKFPWLTYDVYSTIKKEKKKKNYDLSINFILSVYEAESFGNSKVKGPWVKVKVKKHNKIKYVRTRAYGIGQVIPEFHYAGKNPNDLLNPKICIPISMKILHDYSKLAKNDPVKTLKNYNSGPSSSYYNYKYINKVINLALNKNIKRDSNIAII